MASTAGMLKEVRRALADLYSKGPMETIWSQLTYHSLVGLELIEIPSIAAMTTVATQSSGDDVTGISAQQVAPSLLEMKADQNRAVFIHQEAQRRAQYMGGSFYPQVASQSTEQLISYVDQNIAEYWRGYPAWTTGTAATYHDNVAGDALTAADFSEARGKIMANLGKKDLRWFVPPAVMGQVQAIPGFIPNYQQSEMGNIGLPLIGRINGIPVFESPDLPVSRTVAGSASSITSNVMTITVAAGHGLVAGMFIKTTGGTANVTSSTAITSTTSNSVVVAKTASNDAANGALTIELQSNESYLVDKNHCHFGWQTEAPEARIVERSDSMGDVIQIGLRWGRVARAGRVRVLHSPLVS